MRSMYAVLSPESKHRLCSSSKVHHSASPSKDQQRKLQQQHQQRVASRKKCRRVFRIRMRVTARLHFLERLRQMCLRLVLGSRCRNVCDSPKPDHHRGVHHRQQQQQQQQQQEACARSSYCEDAVAECIKFIKQTATPAADSRSVIC